MIRSRTDRRALFVLAVILICFAWLARPSLALAHAKLVRSTPASGALLDAPPDKVVLDLSESASTQFSNIKVLDRARKEQPLGALTAANLDGTSLSAPLNKTLPPGTYTVIWRVLSTADGHLTAGSFSFRVRGSASTGAGAGTQAGSQEEPPPPDVSTPDESASADTVDPLRLLARAVIFACAAFLLGSSLFVVLIAGPSLTALEGDAKVLPVIATRRFAVAGTVAAAALFMGLTLDLLLQVAAITQSGIAGALSQGAAARGLITSTRYGLASITEIAASLVLFGITFFAWRNHATTVRLAATTRNAVVVFALILFLAEALSSHAAATGTEQASFTTLAGVAIFSVPWISDLVHLLTASAWAGGLAYMAFVFFPSMRAAQLSPPDTRALLGQAIPRFSRLAIFSVAALGITGLYNLLIHSTDLGAILGSAYGQVLAVKVVLFLVLVGLGAVNLLRLSPRLRHSAGPQEQIEATGETAPRGAATGLGKNVRLEVALTLVVFACAAGLSLLPPPSSADAGPAQAVGTQPSAAQASPVVTATEQVPALPPTPGPATATTSLAGYTFALLTRPDIDGDQLTLTITRDSPASPPLTDVTKVLIRVTPQDIDAGSTSYPATLVGQAGPDRQTWSITEPILTLDGGYLITAVVQRTQSPDLRAGFRLDLTEDNALRASPAQVVEVRVSTLPSPPISGTATVNLTVVDGAGSTIDGAKVTVNPLMPAHAHAEPIAQAQPVPGKPGTYTLPVNFVMSGSWLLVFTVERNGLPPMKVDASLEVLDPNGTPTP